MSDLSEKQRALIEKKLSQINELRPISPSALKRLREHFSIEMTYNSNAIEGNSLTLRETALVVRDGLTVKGKSLRDHLEAKDHNEALEYLYELVDHAKRHTISEHLIRTLHQLVTRETEAEEAGRYRDSNVMITGADHAPPDAVQVPHEMQSLMKWVQTHRKNLHCVELAALFHHRLVHIHPFSDGNGRTARLAMNVLLMHAGYPLVTILRNDRKRYYRVLSDADRGNAKPLVQFIARAVERSLNMYLQALAPKKQRETFVPLSQLAKQSRYSAKYLNLLVRQGKLEAHKEGRNWISSEEALQRYIDSRQRKR